MPFQPSLMFAGKAGAYPSEALLKGLYPQNLDKLEKTYLGQTLHLITNIRKLLSYKRIYSLLFVS